jgi:hypothetical protein
MKTTIDIPDPLLDQLRLRAVREKTTLRELFHTALKQFLSPRRPTDKPFKLKDGSFKGRGLVPGVQEGEWAQIREMIYEKRGG